MELADIIALDGQHFMNTFGARTPVAFTHGKGLSLYSTTGEEYYDFLGGIAVNTLGHAHPKLVGAISRQAARLIHCSSLYYIEAQARLAAQLTANSCAQKVFFANSGAEANEGAIKLARMYWQKAGRPEKYEIITLTNSFHGRTLTTLAATGQDKFHAHLGPLMPGFKHVPINDLAALEAALTPHTCALMLEPVQGESGVHLTKPDYLAALRQLCNERGLLLIFDEIQCGMGRTGKLFAYEYYGVEPDIFTLAKGLGGGFPIGALLAKDAVAQAFAPGDHGSTFGGGPLACAAGLAVMDVLLDDGLLAHAACVGAYFKQALEALAQRHPVIKEVRGLGLMLAIEFTEPIGPALREACFGAKYLLGSVGNHILRILPPLIVTESEIDGLIGTLDRLLK